MTLQRTRQATTWFSGNARLMEIPRHDDDRGSLLPLEFGQLPFAPQRLFAVSGMAAGTLRGGHAHREGQQLLLCLQGRVDVCLRHGDEEVSATLLPDRWGLLIGPRVWCQQTYVEAPSVLLVVSSEPYDADSYIEHWDQP